MTTELATPSETTTSTSTQTIADMMSGMKSTKAPATSAPNAPEAPLINADWFLAEGIPGTGPRPDYLDPKFKNLAEQARSYKEIEKALGGTKGAPENYDFGDFKDVLDIEHPQLNEYVAYAKQNRISQEAFTKTLDTFVKYQKSFEPDWSKEIEKLGPDGSRKIETVRRWAENNLSDNAIQTIGKISKGAEVIELLDELRQFQFHESQQPPGATSNGGFIRMTVAQVENKMAQNYKKYMSDPDFRAEITRDMEQAVG